MINRLYVERKSGFEIEARNMYREIKDNLLVSGIESVRYLNRYDTEDISGNILNIAKHTVFSEPQTDTITDDIVIPNDSRVLAVEYLPGQYDQRADSCSQCIQILTQGERPKIRTAKIYIFTGNISDDEYDKIKNYIINPVESREASLEIPKTLTDIYDIPGSIEIIDGFIDMKDDMITDFIKMYSLAMDFDDVKFCINYFRDEEKRNPTLTELRMIDTYWSDHCRHTTFLTSIENVKITDDYIRETYDDYITKRTAVYENRKKDISLMDLATIGAKYLKKTGQLKNLDESEEINACSVKIKVNVTAGDGVNGIDEDWLLMFKNETHNHPTEIEPFGGAATCLGGAIRDPLSGRSYVYQAMRVTGAADPRLPVSETMPGKLAQSKLTQGAANGYSSYGNQIGLATGGVYELYHPNYVAKRLEIGAVIGAAPESNVIREVPSAGDKIILLGGRTGRDGLGGATGSSKSHTADSLATCGAEVQKGNPPEERKIQRLFRNPDVTRLIKRCNDFGAGGVSVAIGELADGLMIDLNKVPKKYEGLDGTELAVSESQERMAVVVRAGDTDKFIQYAAMENLEATVVAEVMEEPRLKMTWNGQTTVDLSREFLNSNGAPKKTDIIVNEVKDTSNLFAGITKTNDIKSMFKSMISDLNVCSQKGLVERFDSSIGAATIVMPYGGKHQLTPTQYMAAKIPVTNGETNTISLMAYGFNPFLSEMSPYHGAMYAVIDSISKIVSSGASYENCYLTFQEYFERTQNDPSRWGKPFAALLGAYKAQIELGIGAIGGKDSMSGTFENLDVPPTLVSFAVATSDVNKIVTPEFKSAGNNVYLIEPKHDDNMIPDFEDLKRIYRYVNQLAEKGTAQSIYTVGFGGIAEAIVKMSFGNGIGFKFNTNQDNLFDLRCGAFVIESNVEIDGILLGETIPQSSIIVNDITIPLGVLVNDWIQTLEKVFPTRVNDYSGVTVDTFNYNKRSACIHSVNSGKPNVVIPVFPGTNCEYDTKMQFEKSGANVDIFVLNNLNPQSLSESIDTFAELINKSQIFMLPGGFSGGDEPDGSGKFITAVLRNPKIKEAIMDLIDNRDGLILGICNGFQALVKSGLLPYGKILDTMSPDSPTLTYNEIGRHQSMMVNTRVASVNSPWFSNVSVGDIHTIPISHGEGRFIVSDEMLKSLAANGQIATQYVDLDGNPTMDIRYNPNGSYHAIEGIFSPDGRIFGKMGHTERITKNVARNITGNMNQPIFQAGVKYFI